MPIKHNIRTRFDKASSTYDSVAHIQREVAKHLVGKLIEFEDDFVPEIILDLGAGSGYIAEILLPLYPHASFALNELSSQMIKVAQKKFRGKNNFYFIHGDMEEGRFINYDLIISNLALQWVNDLQSTLEKFCKKSKILAFSCLLDGTFNEWEGILESYELMSVLRKHPTKEEMILNCENMKASKIYFEVKDFQVKFENAYSFMKYLKNLGATASAFSIPLNIVKSIIKDYDKELVVTYKIFFGIIKK